MAKVLLWCAAIALLAPGAASAASVGPGYDIEMSRMIPMRDGVALEAWIFKPSHLSARAPAVLELTQYEIDGGRRGDPAVLARRGYVFVQAMVRGRGRSGGDKADNLGLQVGRDGYDAVEWIAAQPWSNGQVVMYGGSFVGMTQWRTAAQLPPHLAAIAPYVAIYPGWDVPNTNGIPQAWSAVILGYTAGRMLNAGFMANHEYWAGKLLEAYAEYRPFGELEQVLGIPTDDWWMNDDGKRRSFMVTWLDHVGDARFNLAAEPRAQDYARMRFPVLTATGYFDDDQPGALRYYANHTAHAPAAAVARHLLIIGPWDHGGTQHPTKEIEGLSIPAAAVIDMDRLHADWYDWVLGRGPRPALLSSRVSYFMMGADAWRHADSLDAATGRARRILYLSDPSGTPQGLLRPGSLTGRASPREPAALLVSDPRARPALELAHDADSEGLTSQFRASAPGVLVFHSAPLARAFELAGHPRLVLECAADTPDFDLWAQLSMVLPDGSAVTLGEDIRRARFRHDPFRAQLVRHGETIEMPFEFKWIAWRIPAGARLRLLLAPLNSPDYQKNYNTGGRIGYERLQDARVSHIRIFHDAERSSRLELPEAAHE